MSYGKNLFIAHRINKLENERYEDYWFKKEQALGVKRLFPFNYDVIMPDDTELKDMLESLVNEVNGRHEETET